MNIEELTEGQKARARACKSPEELLELAMSEGIELFDQVALGGIIILRVASRAYFLPSMHSVRHFHPLFGLRR